MPESIEKLSQQVNAAIGKLVYNNKVRNLYAPIEYTLDAGGKRIRPLLMLMAYQLFRDDYHRIMNNALAMEVYHNFTLLHDDVMDHARMRRGHPCVHVKWDENTAILSGDTMLALAYKLMTENTAFFNDEADRLPAFKALEKAMVTFNEATIGVCEGQQSDMDFEIEENVTEAQYMEMIRLKTSLLLSCSLKIGAQLAGAPDHDAQLLYQFGKDVGLAFQLQDDLLDVYADEKVFGKHTGGDITENKKTFMLIKTMELADNDQRAQLLDWISRMEFDRTEKVNAVTAIYNEVGIRNVCEQRINALFNKALRALDQVCVTPDRKQPLYDIAQKLLHRQS